MPPLKKGWDAMAVAPLREPDRNVIDHDAVADYCQSLEDEGNDVGARDAARRYERMARREARMEDS
jgi:hypothetical protein